MNAIQKAQHKYYRKDPRKHIYKNARYRAQKQNIPFSITIDDIVIPEFCPILGIPIFIKSGGRGPSHNSPSLDKIVPDLGYIKGNIAVISNKANSMKQNNTIESLNKILEYMNNFNSNTII